MTASAFNQLGQYTSSPGHRGYCYAELAVFFLTVAVIIASTHCGYPRRDGQAELAWVAGYPATDHPTANRAQHTATILIQD